MSPISRKCKSVMHETIKDLAVSRIKQVSSYQKSLIHFTELPLCIQEMVFGYLDLGTICKIRLVCRHFNIICSSFLNKEFRKLRICVQQKFGSTKQQMPRRESVRRKHLLTRECDILETLHMRLTLLQMTFGKHIERNFCCFFPGEILDEVNKILSYVKNTPNLNQAYKVTDELFDLTTMAMEYFKEHIEPTLPEVTYFGMDVMDCVPNASKTQNKISSIDESTGNVPTAYHSSLQKQLQKIQYNTKRNNRQVVTLRRKLHTAQHRINKQQKQVINLKMQLERYDTKLMDVSHKLNAVIQELGYCKTELQLWRSKSPSVQCICGKATPIKGLKDDMPETNETDYMHNQEFKPISTYRLPPVCNCSLGPTLPQALNDELSEISSEHLLPFIESNIDQSEKSYDLFTKTF